MRTSSRSRRSAVVLLIVMAMLALFATVGLSFVFYAEAEANAAMVRRQAETMDLADLPPEKLLAYFLNQQIFDTDNVHSGLRGMSFGRSLYGSPGGTVPFNGVGRLLNDAYQINATATPAVGEKQKVHNLTFFGSAGETLPVREPEGGLNVPYTFPDHNNPFLASINPDGEILMRSYQSGNANLTINDAWQKFLTVRPHSTYHTSFVNPLITGDGDVRNLEGAKGTKINGAGTTFLNDSFWIDLGFPVMTAKDGTKYKPLFAPLILDLDNRVNLSIAGNYLAAYATAGSPTSRNGIGPFEINLAKVLTDTSEIAKLFAGSTTAPSRYGPNNVPDYSGVVSFGTSPFYSKVNYGGTSPQNLQLPLPTTPPTYTAFPTYPGTWVDAVANHPAGYDYLEARFGTNDTRLAASNMDALLRYGEKGTPAVTSDLLRLFTNNLNLSNTTANKNRHLVTTISTSLDTAHLAPFFSNNPAGTYRLNLNTAGTADKDYPESDIASLQQTIIPGMGEFTAEFRSKTAALRRINLNRTLKSYVPYPTTAAQTTNNLLAWQERVAMASEIFDRLRKVTGANPDVSALPVNNLEYKAVRWLAQLAVNIVDFIDEDDVMTTFQWNTRSDGTKDYVFGFEHPRVLINEAFVTIDNDKGDPGLADLNNANSTYYKLNAWIELYNPLAVDGTLRDSGSAKLVHGTRKLYQVLMAKDASGIVDNPTGDSNTPLSVCKDWPNGAMLAPGDRTFSGNGFFTAAPPDSFLDERKADFTGTTFDHTSPGLSARVDFPAADADPIEAKPSLILQRLADPNLDEQADPAAANYNPYVTVDYFKDIEASNSLKYRKAVVLSPAEISTFAARSRVQPLQATGSVDSKLTTPNTDKKPQHTFRRQNTCEATAGAVDPSSAGQTIKTPFDWLPHMDRNLISPAELLHVVSVHPSQVTQKFPSVNLVAYNAFSAGNALLNRFLETVTVGDRMYSTRLAGSGKHPIQVPGKININTIQDKKVLEALFDPQGNSFFNSTVVDNLYAALPGLRPIAGFSDFQLKKVGGNNVVELRPSAIGQLGIIPPASAGKLYEKTEVLRKVMNNLTFTSNTFAVWVTVGFFRVEDATTSPPRLAEEIGKAENRHIRHRMFAIVDRSNMVIPDQQLTTLSAAVAAGATTTTVAAVSGSIPPPASVKVTYDWTLKAGMRLIVDKGLGTQEIVEVTNVTGNTITANFTNAHAGGATVHLDGIPAPQAPFQNTIFGYPGPQAEFNLRDYNYMVPYYNIVD